MMCFYLSWRSKVIEKFKTWLEEFCVFLIDYAGSVLYQALYDVATDLFNEWFEEIPNGDDTEEEPKLSRKILNKTTRPYFIGDYNQADPPKPIMEKDYEQPQIPESTIFMVVTEFVDADGEDHFYRLWRDEAGNSWNYYYIPMKFFD